MKKVVSSFVTAGAAFALSCGFASASTPASLSGISGLALWLDATDIAGNGSATADGPVMTWVDKAGGVNFNAPDAGHAPTVSNSVHLINGLPVVHFARPAADQAQYLSGNDQIVATTFDNENTAFVVTRATAGCADNGSQDPEYVFARVGCHSGLGFGGYPNAVQYYSVRWFSGNSGTIEQRIPGYTQGSAIMYTRAVNGNTQAGPSSVTLSVNNAELDTTSSANAFQGQGTDLHIGCGYTSGGWCGGLDGDIAEMLVYDRILSAAEQKQVWAYLGAKWGLFRLILADPATGSTASTSSSTLDVVDMPVLLDGDEYQVTTSTNAASLDANGWLTYDSTAPVTTITAAPPASDGPWTICLWVRNGGAAVPYPCTISYSSYSYSDAYVSGTGDDVNGTGRPGAPWRTITKAIQKLGGAGTIYVASGEYTAASGETFPLQPKEARIVGTGSSSADAVISASGSNVFAYDGSSLPVTVDIENVTVSGGTSGLFLNGYGNCASFRLADCVFTNASSHGVEATEPGTGALVTNCVFTSNGGNGLLFTLAQSFVIADSAFVQNRNSGFWFHRSANGSILRSIFNANTSCGFGCGDGGWFTYDGSCAGLAVEGCYIASNGSHGIGLANNNTYGWTIDHCTFLGNSGWAINTAGYAYYPNIAISNCIVAYNAGGFYMVEGPMPTSDSMFWGNGGPNFDGTNPGHVANSDLGDNFYDADPLFCPWAGREDGAVWSGSPAIGAASDGLNIGCYQGNGIALPAACIYYIRPDGNDANDGLDNTSSGAFATLAPLVSLSLGIGDVVHIGAGEYQTAISLSPAGISTAPVTLEGEPGTVLVGTSGSPVLTLRDGLGAAINGIEFRGGDGLLVSGVSGCAISNCVFASSAASGAIVEDCSGVSFADCVFTNATVNGLWFYRSTSTTMDHCVFADNGLNGVHGGSNWNWWHDDHACTGTRGSFCYIAGNGAIGIRIDCNGARDWLFDHCTIAGNESHGYGTPGDMVSSIGDVRIADSIVADNKGSGLYMVRNTIYATNTVFHGNVGGDIGGGSASPAANEGNSCIFEDPQLTGRAAGALGEVYDGSPVLGAASDGLNIGYYQGAGYVESFESAAYYVRPDGDDANDGKANTSVGAFQTIARGLAALSTPGDTLSIAAGEYEEAVTLSGVAGSLFSRIVVTAEPGATLVAPEAPPGAALGRTDRANVPFPGLTVGGGAGLDVHDCHSTVVSNMAVTASSGNGATVYDCTGLVIADSAFTNNVADGLWFHSLGLTLVRDIFARNGGCGINTGYGYGDSGHSSGLHASYCYFGGNGRLGIGLSATGLQSWTVDHCSFIGNRMHGFGSNNNSYYGGGMVATNCLFAYNVEAGIEMNMQTIYSDENFFWGNGQPDITCTVDGNQLAAAVRAGNVFDVDAMVCDWRIRDDGAVYVGSPVIGGASDGSNFGCYQGAGVALPAATTYYVDPNGSDANDGLSSATAFATLSNACDRALGPGTTIRVATGTYGEPVVLRNAFGTAASPVRIIGATGATLAIDGISMRIIDSSCVQVSAIAFTDATGAGDTVGLSIEGSGVGAISNCSFTGNETGVATDSASHSFTFIACDFSSNRADGCRIAGSPDIAFDRCTARNNGRDGFYCGAYQALDNWDAFLTTAVSLRQCVAAVNGRAGVYADNAGDIRLESCSVAGNGGDSEDSVRGGAIWSQNKYHMDGNRALNTISAYNDGYGIHVTGDPAGEFYRCGIDTVCAYGNTSGDFSTVVVDANSIQADPLLRDVAHGDCRLRAGSSCINAGTNQAWMATATDLGGHNPRIVDEIVDIGAYEIFLQGSLFLLH